MVNPLIALQADASAPARVAIGAPNALQNTLLTIEDIQQGRQANALAFQQAQQKAGLDAAKFNLDAAKFGETQQKNIAAEDEVERKAALERSDRMSRMVSVVLDNPELYSKIRQLAINEFGPEAANKLPEKFDEGLLLGIASQVEGVRKQLTEGVPLVEIGDASSPTGTRNVRRIDAVDQPGKPPTGFEITTSPDCSKSIRSGVSACSG